MPNCIHRINLKNLYQHGRSHESLAKTHICAPQINAITIVDHVASCSISVGAGPFLMSIFVIEIIFKAMEVTARFSVL